MYIKKKIYQINGRNQLTYFFGLKFLPQGGGSDEVPLELTNKWNETFISKVFLLYLYVECY